MRMLLLIGAGGFLGSVMRYVVSLFIQSRTGTTFPFGTLLVNLAGCLFIGIIMAISERTSMSPEIRIFLATGICGGFTTFSAFSVETMAMIQDGQMLYASVYVASSVVFGLAAAFAGYNISKFF